MSELYTIDNHKRKDAERTEREGIKVSPRAKPGSPNVTLEQAESFADLADKLEASADVFAQRAEGSRASEWDERNAGLEPSPSHEVNYGLLETRDRNIAEAIRKILGTGCTCPKRMKSALQICRYCIDEGLKIEKELQLK